MWWRLFVHFICPYAVFQLHVIFLDCSLIHCIEWAMFILNDWLLNMFFIHCVACGLFTACCLLKMENLISERKYPDTLIFFCLDILTNYWGHIVLSFLELYRQRSKAHTYFCEPIFKCLILHLQEHLVEYIWYYIKLFLRWLQLLLKYWCFCKIFTANEEDSPTFLTLNPCHSVEGFLLKWLACCCLGLWQARNTAPLWQHLFTVLIGWLFVLQTTEGQVVFTA